MVEYLQLWDALDAVELSTDRPDQHLWTPTASGEFSTRSAYRRYFIGAVGFGPFKRTLMSWAPLRAKYFIWLASLNRCWTADHLARWGLQHPQSCPLCDQASENVQHLLGELVFAKEIWFRVFQRVGLQDLALGGMDSEFQTWWSRSQHRVPKEVCKGLNYLVILMVWSIWKHRNRCVFEGDRPNVTNLLRVIFDEAWLWCMGELGNCVIC